MTEYKMCLNHACCLSKAHQDFSSEMYDISFRVHQWFPMGDKLGSLMYTRSMGVNIIYSVDHEGVSAATSLNN